jgi:hypothetical protein
MTPRKVQFRIACCQAVLILAVTTADPGARDQGPFLIGQNVQISAAFGGVQHYETQVAADPDDAAHLLAASYVVNADRSVDNVFYVSFDRGVTWSRTLRVAVGTDPAVAIGRKGTPSPRAFTMCRGPTARATRSSSSIARRMAVARGSGRR